MHLSSTLTCLPENVLVNKNCEVWDSLETAFEGFLAMNRAKRTSKSADLPIIARLEAAACDLQVRDLIQGTPDGAIKTPQWRSRSKFALKS